MITKEKLNGAIIATAVATLLAVAPMSSALAHGTHGKVHCYGVNTCKGEKNSCKGKGTMEMTAKECKKKGGKVMKEEKPAKEKAVKE